MIRAIVIAAALAIGAVYTPAATAPVEVETTVMSVGLTEQDALDAAWNQADMQATKECQAQGFDGAHVDVGVELASPLVGGHLAEVTAHATCR